MLEAPESSKCRCKWKRQKPFPKRTSPYRDTLGWVARGRLHTSNCGCDCECAFHSRTTRRRRSVRRTSPSTPPRTAPAAKYTNCSGPNAHKIVPRPIPTVPSYLRVAFAVVETVAVLVLLSRTHEIRQHDNECCCCWQRRARDVAMINEFWDKDWQKPPGCRGTHAPPFPSHR